MQVLMEAPCLQILAGDLQQAGEAERWLKEHTPWLSAPQRQDILRDLQHASQQQGSTAHQPALQASAPAHQEQKLSWASSGVYKVQLQ